MPTESLKPGKIYIKTKDSEKIQEQMNYECKEENNDDFIDAMKYTVKGITEGEVSMTLEIPKEKVRCGDNGIFKGVPLTEEETQVSYLAHQIYNKYNSDGKYIIDMPSNKTIICQSNAKTEELKAIYPTAIINPLGEWTGGLHVDTGATNRKLGSDMGKGVTGGGLHGKDLSKADVSINIYAFLKAQETGKPVELSCAIGDEIVDEKPYEEIVEQARKYIQAKGGFEKFAEWGLF